jgi:XTP/dITP diphosphohydrolase
VSLTLLVTSPRVAPGLMSGPAWSRVSSADRRLASSADAPLARAVAEAGHRVETVAAPTGAALLDLAATGEVVWLADGAEGTRLPALVAGSPLVHVLEASYDLPGGRFLDLVAVMDRLRRECPWDREQTHRSLARYLLEETYETLEALESEDTASLAEELGDLMLQVVFHARLAAESAAASGGFTIDDVAAGIVEKLVRRHPHVFAGPGLVGGPGAPDAALPDVADVERSWERIKDEEKGRRSVLDGVPAALPALAWADKVLGWAARSVCRRRSTAIEAHRRRTLTEMWDSACWPSS